jgi:hypothetical protein
MGAYGASALGDVSASCPPEGPSFVATDFSADLAAAAFAPIFGSGSTADLNTLDLSSEPLSFPVLPASLLDEAPEYEYVSRLFLSHQLDDCRTHALRMCRASAMARPSD